MAISTIKFIEDNGIGLRVASKHLMDAAHSKNSFCLVESSFETGSAFSQLLYCIAWLPNKLHTYDIYPISGMTEGLAIAGIAANALKLGQETLSFARQQLFLRIFTEYAWKEKKIIKTLTKTISGLPPQERLAKHTLEILLGDVRAGDGEAIKYARQELLKGSVEASLEKIIQLDHTEIERALPEWLFKELTDKGARKHFEGLLKNVKKGNQAAIEESVKLLETMRSYASKKTILHVIGMISAIVGIVGCIGLLIAFPFLATVGILVLVVILGILTYAVRCGYVENPDGDFSLDRCIPEFLKRKADPYKDIPPYLRRASRSDLLIHKSALFDFSQPAYRSQRQERTHGLKVSPRMRQSADPTQPSSTSPRIEKPKKPQRRYRHVPSCYSTNLNG
jgi:hypothetical protein